MLLGGIGFWIWRLRSRNGRRSAVHGYEEPPSPGI